ncbi:MAG: hypothetical protein AAGF95_15720 [Chloroflexota bacterium]
MIDRTFTWLGCGRWLDKDDERLPENSESGIYIGSIRLVLRRLHARSLDGTWERIWRTFLSRLDAANWNGHVRSWTGAWFPLTRGRWDRTNHGWQRRERDGGGRWQWVAHRLAGGQRATA